MEDTKKMSCDNCKRLVSASDIKYLPKGKYSKVALCSECRAKNDSKKEINSKKEITSLDTTPKIIYVCERCNYKFKSVPSDKTKCPYCSKSDSIIKHKVISADSLIKNS